MGNIATVCESLHRVLCGGRARLCAVGAALGLFLLLLVPGPARGQQAIGGTVLSEATLQPLAGAQVLVVGTGAARSRTSTAGS